MNKELEALEKIDHTICLAFGENNKALFNKDNETHIDCRDIYEFFDCYCIIGTALKEKEEQDNIINIIKETIEFDVLEPQVEVKENGKISLLSRVGMSLRKQLNEKEKELFRAWILKECFPEELRALETIKENSAYALMFIDDAYCLVDTEDNKFDIIDDYEVNSKGVIDNGTQKKLRALEIIKEKKINLEYLKCCETYEQYKTICSYWNEITKEEYDLLKEVLS